MKVKTLETDRLLLRGFNAGDLEDFYQYAKKPNIGPSAGWKPHDSREESLCILGNLISGDKAVWALIEKESGRFIGSMALSRDSKRNLDMDEMRNLGYALDDTAWGKGYATEAAVAVLRYGFEEMCLLMVSVQHYPYNDGSRRVIEKCGFRYEGTLRMSAKLFDGSIQDNVCYSMTRMEFEERYGPKE